MRYFFNPPQIIPLKKADLREDLVTAPNIPQESAQNYGRFWKFLKSIEIRPKITVLFRDWQIATVRAFIVQDLLIWFDWFVAMNEELLFRLFWRSSQKQAIK